MRLRTGLVGQDGQPKTGRRFYYLALSYGYIQPDMSPEGHQLGPVRPDSKFALLQMQTRHDYRTKGPTLFESINVTTHFGGELIQLVGVLPARPRY